VRVSSSGQNTDRQLDGLLPGLDKVFEEKASGKSAERPELKAMLDYVRQGDEVLVHSMDRLARNLDDLRRLVQFLTKKGVKVTFAKENMTFTGDDSHMSMLMLSMMGAFAEFERALLLERQREGIAKAKARGAYKGRKPSLNPQQAHELRARAKAGEKKAALAKEFNISRETLYQYLRIG
jgi:DNA invertase Pin-like site-specific DNA recombinase